MEVGKCMEVEIRVETGKRMEVGKSKGAGTRMETRTRRRQEKL